jgi:hypothetical protein
VPWRGPAFPGEFPTLGYIVAGWIEELCVIPDRQVAGRPIGLSDDQLAHLLWQFRLWPNATYHEDRPAAPFVFTGSLIVRAQKWGKGPFSACRLCAQAIGPVLFAGWDANGDPVGMPWAKPLIQVAAVAEDQTDNIWRSLKPMIELGPLADLLPDTGLTRINIPGGGRIERVASNSTTALGANTQYVEIDQPESMTKRNGGVKLYDTLLRNTAGANGRYALTGNAHDPSEQSVQQTLIDSELDDVHIDYPEPPAGSWKNKRDRRRILNHSYKGAPWVDVDRVESDCNRLEKKGEPAQAERFFGNRVVSGSDKAFNLDTYKKLTAETIGIAKDRKVGLGFDGSLTRDATGLVAADLETGHVVTVRVWERPPGLDEDDEWEVPIDEVNEAVAFAFDFWDVVKFYADPPHYRDDLNRWAGDHGTEIVVLFWTNHRQRMAIALRDYKNDMRPGVMSHGPLDDTPEAARGYEALIRHHGNAIKKPTNIRDEDDRFLWLIGKESAKSPNKIDLAMAACLAWSARGDAIKGGALNEPEYGRASW